MHPGTIFISIGFPFVDLRCFLDQASTPTHRLTVPQFPLVDIGAGEFIRSSGSVQQRLGGGIDEWPGEEVFGKAAAALRFPNHLEKRQDFVLRDEEAHFRMKYVFRRFYSEGRISRFEVGMRLNNVIRPCPSLTASECLATLQRVFALQVRIPSARQGVEQSCPLIEAGRPLAEHYLRATTERTEGKLPQLEKWWFKVGNPVVLFHYRPSELVAELPPHCKIIQISEGQDFSVACLRLINKNIPVITWLLGSSLESETDRLRRLRIHIFRLHMEREGLKEVLRHINSKQIPLTAATTDYIQAYLDSAISLLERGNRYGLDQASMVEAAKYLVDLISPGQSTTLLSQLQQVRRNVTRKVESLAQKDRASAAISIVLSNSPGAVVNTGGVDMSNKSITFGDNTTVTGNFTVAVAEKIERSFNNASKADASNELKDELKKLAIQVAEMVKQLPAKEAESAARDLESLTNEVTSQEPRRKWYELSADGLIEAAKTIGEIATPVITTIKAILTLVA